MFETLRELLPEGFLTVCLRCHVMDFRTTKSVSLARNTDLTRKRRPKSGQ